MQEQTEEWFGINSKLKEDMKAAWETLPVEADAAFQKTQDITNNNPLLINLDIQEMGPSKISQIMGELSGLTTAFGQTIGDALYDGIHGNIPSVQELFRGFSHDIADNLYQNLTDSINSAFEDAAAAMESGGEGGEGGAGAGIGAFFGALDKDFWLDAGAAVATAFSGRAQAEADKTGAAIAGAVSGAIQGAKFGVVGAVVGAIVGGLIGYFGAQKADTPEARANLGYTRMGWFGQLDTRNAQLFTDEMERTWVQQQAVIFDALKMGYRTIIESFGDPELLADLSLANLPTFEMPVGQWMEAGAADLATYLKETYWPDAFRQYFSAALEAGLGTYGVSEASVAALMAELERLPGTQTLQALADFVQAVVGSAELLEQMDFESVWQEVIQSPRAAMIAMGEEITNQLAVWATGWEALTGVEQARQLIQITDLISAARDSEIQYLRQIYQIQQNMNRSIEDQIEQLNMQGMTDAEKATYLWDRIQGIFSALRDPDIDANAVANLTTDAQNYIRLLEQLLNTTDPNGIPDLDRIFYAGGNLFESLGLPQELLDQFRGMTGREGLVALLEYLRSLSNAAIEGEIDESEIRLAEYNRILGETNALLLTFGEILSDIIGDLTTLNPPTTPTPFTDDPDDITPTRSGWAGRIPTIPATIAGALSAPLSAPADPDPVNNPVLTVIETMNGLIASLPSLISSAISQTTMPVPKQTTVIRIDGTIQNLISAIDSRIIEWETGVPVGGME
jgi:hypothetical protein